jgi:hypothetical protein
MSRRSASCSTTRSVSRAFSIISACAQRHGEADAGSGERVNLTEPLRAVGSGPFGKGGQFTRRKGQRPRIGPQTGNQESVSGNGGRGPGEHAHGDEAAVVRRRALAPREQRGRFDAQLVAHAREDGVQCPAIRVGAARGVDEG